MAEVHERASDRGHGPRVDVDIIVEDPDGERALRYAEAIKAAAKEAIREANDS